MSNRPIPFGWPHMTGKELYYIAEAHFNGHLAGDGPFTKKCHGWLEKHSGSPKALLTHSCTAALELSALLLNIQPGDEVIMPSYTFVSTANAFVLRGAVPVFVDIREDTLNLDERMIESAITERTRVIVPVHYAGVSCEMDAIMAVARHRGISVVEDAAQGMMSKYKGRALGTIGDLGVYSFHETKNVISGEGGALLVNHPGLISRAEIIREKGTDRSRFFRGEVDKYTWQEVGSSFLPGELIAAFLWAQLEDAEKITQQRIASWQFYHQLLQPMEQRGMIRRPVIPEKCEHNAHMYYVLLPSASDREAALTAFKQENIGAVFHYVPLHSAPAGQRYGRAAGPLSITESTSNRLIRLPLFIGLTGEQQEQIVTLLNRTLHKRVHL